jgi:hypothetical protein
VQIYHGKILTMEIASSQDLQDDRCEHGSGNTPEAVYGLICGGSSPLLDKSETDLFMMLGCLRQTSDVRELFHEPIEG